MTFMHSIKQVLNKLRGNDMAGKIRWGVISTARIGTVRVIPAIQKSNNGRVVAISSRDQARAQKAADELGIEKTYGSYEELINDPDIDAIYNPLPNSEHAEWSIKCAEAGKPTLCEKPLAKDVDEAQRMVDTFKERGVLFAEAFMYRFHPKTQKVKEMIDAGAIGKLHLISAEFTFPIGDESNIRLNQELAGGSVMDVGCYCINAMRFMTGEEPGTVKGVAQFGAVTGVDEWLAGTLQFPSGVVGHFDSSLRSQFSNTYDIRGSEGRIVLEAGFVSGPNEAATIRHWRGSDYKEIVIPAINHYTLMAEDFADALITNRPPRFDPQDGVENMRVIDRLLASAREA
jgi:predicted dehydrogenase